MKKTARAAHNDGDPAGAKPGPGVPDPAAEDRAIIARVRSGDRAAFGVLVERHLPRALGLAYRVLRHREDAEDLVQDAFLAALEHIDAFDQSREFWPWFARILVNRGLDLAAARSVRATEPIPADALSGEMSSSERTEHLEVLTRFRHELALLPPRQQLVVQLFELDGYSVAEIADLIGASPSTVRWHVHMARQRLRVALAPFRGDER